MQQPSRTSSERHGYFIFSKNCYAGLVRHQNYGWSVMQLPGFNVERLPKIIEETHHRLARVQIECLPYEKVLKHYDRATTLFYLDPPYYERKLYKFNLEPEEFRKMAERLGKLDGKFVLSLNDVPEVRAIFKEFKIRGIDLHYTAQKIRGRRFSEVLITHF